MKKINENNLSTDYVVGTGIGRSIEEIINFVFEYLNMDYKNYISINSNILRDNEPLEIISNPKKLKKNKIGKVLQDLKT